jgi:hypothetical protein
MLQVALTPVHMHKECGGLKCAVKQHGRTQHAMAESSCARVPKGTTPLVKRGLVHDVLHAWGNWAALWAQVEGLLVLMLIQWAAPMQSRIQNRGTHSRH